MPETLQRPTILVVDDDAAILRLIGRILYGVSQVLTVNSPHVALEVLASQKVDLVVSDHDMPGMNGRELLAEVRKHWPSTARVLMSGNYNLDIASMQHSGEVEHFVRKPFQAQEFRTEILERARTEARLPA